MQIHPAHTLLFTHLANRHSQNGWGGACHILQAAYSDASRPPQVGKWILLPANLF